MAESKDRAALRLTEAEIKVCAMDARTLEMLADMHDMASIVDDGLGNTVAADYHVTRSSEIRLAIQGEVARAALAQPDPAEQLAEALRALIEATEVLGREESDRDPTEGEEATFTAADAARAALAAWEQSK